MCKWPTQSCNRFIGSAFQIMLGWGQGDRQHSILLSSLTHSTSVLLITGCSEELLKSRFPRGSELQGPKQPGPILSPDQARAFRKRMLCTTSPPPLSSPSFLFPSPPFAIPPSCPLFLTHLLLQPSSRKKGKIFKGWKEGAIFNVIDPPSPHPHSFLALDLRCREA